MRAEFAIGVRSDHDFVFGRVAVIVVGVVVLYGLEVILEMFCEGVRSVFVVIYVLFSERPIFHVRDVGYKG